VEFWDVIKLLILSAIITFGIKKWWESGFWLPKWLHLVAFIMLLVGAGLAELATLSHHPKADLHQWFVVGFPLSVYITFIFHGGATAYIRKIGSNITYHASMNKKDVLAIFIEYIPKYLDLTIPDVLAIGEEQDPVEIRRNEKCYLLFVKSTKVEDEEGAYIPVIFWLEDHTKSRKYIPLALTQLVYSPGGDVLLNPLDNLKK
jgi:hypothetical protein